MNDLQFIAPMVVSVVLILTIGGVFILRPIAKQLGAYLEQLTKEKAAGHGSQEIDHMRGILESMDQRLALMEERQEFTDRLLLERDTAKERLPIWRADENGT